MYMYVHVYIYMYIHITNMCMHVHVHLHIHIHTHTHTHVTTCTVSEKQRLKIYREEMSQAAETAKALVEGMSNKASIFTTATHVEHVKAMFKVRCVCWCKCVM